MSKPALPKGRARRGETVEKIIKAYEESGKESLSFASLHKITGVTNKALSKALKEMMELGSLEREVTDNSPPDVHYVFVEGLTDDKVKALEEEYEEDYRKTEGILDYVNQVENDARRKGLEYIRSAYVAQPSIIRDKHHFDRNKIELRKLYYISLRICISHLKDAFSEAYKDSTPKDWERCGNCRYGKHIYEKKIDGKPAVRCTYEWRDRREIEREHPSNYFCENFEPKIPKD